MATLFKLTNGVPRLINLVCQHSLLAAYSTEARQVTPKLVKQAAAEILGRGNTLYPILQQWRYWVLPLVLIAAVGMFYALQPSAPAVVGPVTKSSVSSAAVTVADTDTASRNPYSALFDLWSVEVGEIYSEEEAEALASGNGLRVELIKNASLVDLQTVNRPGIIRLEDQNGYLKSVLLSQINPFGVILQSQDSEPLDTQSFVDRWSGTFVYLWRPPQQIDSLKLGDTDPQAVAWLQSKLAAVDKDAEVIISAGRYSQAIADQVLSFQRQQNIKADGVVGRETLLRLNQLTEQGVPLLMKESG
jgi:general secretion pathway protein A